MKLNIKTTNTTITPAVSDYVTKRLDKISRLLDSDPSAICDVELAKISGHHNKGDIFKAEIHIVGVGKNVYASVEKDDLYAAIDGVRDDIIRELISGKTKRLSYVRRGGARVKAMIKGFWPWKRN